MAVRWVLLVTLFLIFVAETMSTYSVWVSPFGWAHDLLFEALPWKIRPFDHIVGACLIVALMTSDGKGPRVVQMRNAILLSGATTVLWFVYGVVRGGGAWQASWQIYLMLSGVLLALAVGAAFRTPQHYVLLAKMVLAAAAYRAAMCWMFYILYIHTMRIQPPPEYITSHDDTVLWVVSILILMVHAIETPRLWSRLKSILFLMFLFGAVIFNQRRIAWVSLAMGAAVVFVLLPPGRNKRRLTRYLLAFAPVAMIYIAVGWGRNERIFKPLQSIATVTTQEDTSTKARNVENLGLIATSNANGMLMGTGWGHPYIEVSSQYSIAEYFPLWQYIPHNSILGLLAYTGVLGFCGYWLAFPTAMFINARMARLGNNSLARQAGLVGAAQLVVCANQYYGDMGIYYLKGVYMLAFSYAIALRLPIAAGVWPVKGKRRTSAQAQTAPAATPFETRV